MAPQRAGANGDPTVTSHIEPGEFPFPLTGGPAESPYLTWLRNHSNYMAARGLFDYLRAVSVLGRGIIINFLIFLPYLLLVAIALAYAHHWMRAHPFLLTFWAFVCAVAWILLFPVLVPLFRIFAYNRGVETGSESSVKQRDLYERSFGALLFVILVTAALELEPWILEFLHDQILLGRIAWPGGLATVAAGLALLSGSDKLLSALSGVKKQLAMVLVGVLGLLVPLIVVLSATDFLLYGLPLTRWVMFSPLAVPIGGVLAITTAIALGRKVFTGKEISAVVGLLFVALALGWGVILVASSAADASEKSKNDLAVTLSKVHELASQFESISNRQELDPEVATLVDQFVEASREAGNLQDQNFEQELPLVSLGDELSAQPEKSLEGLNREITKLAYGRLLKVLEDRGNREDQIADLLRSTLVSLHVYPCFEAPPSWNEPIPAADLEGIRARFLEAEGKCAPETLDEYEDVLQTLGTELRFLVKEEELYEKVAEKFKEVPGKAEIARLAGKEELAKLLTTEELVAVVFPIEASQRRELLTRARRPWLLEDALPAFPQEGTQDYQEGTLRTALALARLESRRPATAPDTLKSQKLALFYSTRAPAVEEDRTTVTENPTTEEIARAAGEVLAKRVLKDFDVDHLRALAFGLDMEQLYAAPEGAENGTKVEIPELATDPPSGDKYVFTLTDDAGGRFAIDASSGAVTVADGTRLNYALAASHTITVQATDQRGLLITLPFAITVVEKEQWQEFLELAKRPLEDLVSHAFSSLPSQEGVRTEEDSRDIWNRPPYRLPDEYRDRVLVAEKALGNDTDALARLARAELINRVFNRATPEANRSSIVEGFATHALGLVDDDQLAYLWLARFIDLREPERATTDDLSAKLMFGVLGRLEQDALSALESQVTNAVLVPKAIFVSLLMVVIWLGCWLTVDVNLTSIHGLYRDRLASAFLVGKDTKGDIDIEDDIDLDDICCYDAGSTAPYHLINVALNLQGSKDVGIRDRKSDFFFFSKRFIGGNRTGYCRSETMEQVFPQMDLATAMAISAAAASPNMGRATSPLLVAFMTLLNIRLGYWLPNPGLLEEQEDRRRSKPRRGDRRRATTPGFTFEEVFAAELQEIEKRWGQVYPEGSQRRCKDRDENDEPTVKHGLVGIGFSGGGIRSAVFNLGVSQALHTRGVFDHLDYMSTVSGGGYLGSSLSTLMRSRGKSEIAGTVRIEANGERQLIIVEPKEASETPRIHRVSADATLIVRNGQNIEAGESLLNPRAAWGKSDFDGTVTVLEETSAGGPIVRVRQSDEYRDYRFSRFDSVVVKNEDTVKAGDRLIQRYDTLGQRFHWRVRPVAFLREMIGKLDETHRWVNISDGGHIENLGGIELLRRRCKYIILGDGEADPQLHFAGLATLMRYAQIDLGIRIDIDLDAIRLRTFKERGVEGTASGAHWALGTITYPPKVRNGHSEKGYLLYLKSSFTGDEGEVIREYRHRNPTFPHQSTADQSFDEDQFEAYRALGQHIAEDALDAPNGAKKSHGAVPLEKMSSFGDFERWLTRLQERGPRESEAKATTSSA